MESEFYKYVMNDWIPVSIYLIGTNEMIKDVHVHKVKKKSIYVIGINDRHRQKVYKHDISAIKMSPISKR